MQNEPWSSLTGMIVGLMDEIEFDAVGLSVADSNRVGMGESKEQASSKSESD